MPVIVLDPGRHDRWDRWYDLPRWKAAPAPYSRRHQKLPGCEFVSSGRPRRSTSNRTMATGTASLAGRSCLCRQCHALKWANDYWDYSTTVGAGGYPLDPRHPFMRADELVRRCGRKRLIFNLPAGAGLVSAAFHAGPPFTGAPGRRSWRPMDKHKPSVRGLRSTAEGALSKFHIQNIVYTIHR